MNACFPIAFLSCRPAIEAMGERITRKQIDEMLEMAAVSTCNQSSHMQQAHLHENTVHAVPTDTMRNTLHEVHTPSRSGSQSFPSLGMSETSALGRRRLAWAHRRKDCSFGLNPEAQGVQSFSVAKCSQGTYLWRQGSGFCKPFNYVT